MAYNQLAAARPADDHPPVRTNAIPSADPTDTLHVA